MCCICIRNCPCNTCRISLPYIRVVTILRNRECNTPSCTESKRCICRYCGYRYAGNSNCLCCFINASIICLGSEDNSIICGPQVSMCRWINVIITLSVTKIPVPCWYIESILISCIGECCGNALAYYWGCKPRYWFRFNYDILN